MLCEGAVCGVPAEVDGHPEVQSVAATVRAAGMERSSCDAAIAPAGCCVLGLGLSSSFSPFLWGMTVSFTSFQKNSRAESNSVTCGQDVAEKSGSEGLTTEFMP